MKNFNEMTTEQLLGEKCYYEQLGFTGEVFVLEINEIIEARWKAEKEAKQEEAKQEVKAQPEVKTIDRRKQTTYKGSKNAKTLKAGDKLVIEMTRNQIKYIKVETVERISNMFVLINNLYKRKVTTEVSTIL